MSQIAHVDVVLELNKHGNARYESSMLGAQSRDEHRDCMHPVS